MEEPISDPSTGPSPREGPPREVAGPSSAWCLAILVVAAPAYYLTAFVVYGYATADLVDGRWAGLILAFLEETPSELPQLLGARSRFIWLGLVMLYVPLMLSISAFSLVVVARRAGDHARLAVGALAIVAAACGAGVWLLGANQLSGCFTDACGATCAATSTGFPFSIVRYLGALFCRLYDPSFVAFFRRFFVLVGPVHLATMALYFAAILSLLVGPRKAERRTITDLRQRVSDFLVILILGSALLTLTALTELTLWGWFVEIADGWPDVAVLRSLQIGSALYWGMCNSALMLLAFAPIAIVLARQARALARLHNAGAATPALEAWEREHGVTLHGRAMWPQVVGVLAPLLTGAFAFLFEKTVGAG
jgi:hypothetical protein